MNFMKVFLFAVALFSSVNLYARQACTRTYSLGVTEDQLRSKDDKNTKPGLATEFLGEIKKRVNCIYTEKVIFPEKALTELQKFRLDLFAFAFSDERFRAIADEEVLYSTNRILLVDKKYYKAGLTVQDYLKNSKMKFGTISASAYWFSPEELKLLTEQRRMISSIQVGGSADLLLKGKVQAIFVSPAFLNLLVQSKDILKESVAISDPTFHLTVVLLISKKRVSSEERKQFADAFANMRQEGVIEKILLHYVSPKDLKTYYKY